MEYLSIRECDLDGFLANAKMNLANSHPGDSLNNVSDFYTEIVGDRHVADLAAWHITSRDYIADTLKLQQRFSRDIVLDFEEVLVRMPWLTLCLQKLSMYFL